MKADAPEMNTSPAVKLGDATDINRLATHAIGDNGRALCNEALMAMFGGRNGEVTCASCKRRLI